MRNHKTLVDMQRVIALGKPDAVVDIFISDYLAGVALAPIYAAEDEYADLLEQEDRENLPAVVDEATGAEINPEINHNQLRDDRITALTAQYPHIVDSELDRPVPEIDAQTFREIAIVNELRRAAYPDIGDQLDAIWKQLNYDRMEGRELIRAADDILGSVLAVKQKFKKAERPK